MCRSDGLNRLLTMPLWSLGRAALLALCTTPLLAACAGFGLLSSPDENWEARYRPAAGCALRVSSGTSTSALQTGALVVRLTQLGSAAPVRRAGVTVTPLGAPPSVSPPRSSAYDTGAVRSFQNQLAQR